MAYVSHKTSAHSALFESEKGLTSENGMESEKRPGCSWGQPCYIWVDLTGHILDSDDNTFSCFGYRPKDLKGQPIALLIPSLDETALIEEQRINPRLAYRSRCGIPFEIVDQEGHRSPCSLFFNRVRLPSGAALSLICVPLQH